MTPVVPLPSSAPRRRPRMQSRRAALLAAACAAAVAAPAYPQAGAGAVSPAVSSAETLLFETDHLARVTPPAVLVYTFRKVSNVEPGFSDEVRLDLAGARGKLRATLHFLSGAHAHDVPALDEAHGNPVLLGFLERDIAEMSRLTGGSAAYFRKRIRMALADHAQVGARSITWQGKPVPAKTVRIQPYEDDPMHARFERYVHKTYTFVFADGVPGQLYQLHSSLLEPGKPRATTVAATAAPAPGASATPEIDETLTLAGITHPRQ